LTPLFFYDKNKDYNGGAVDRKQIVDALCSVIDPEIGMDLVTLGLIYNVNIKDDKVEITMTLTFSGCPLASMMINDMKEKLEALAGEGNAKINLVFEPKWNQTMISEQNSEKLLKEENASE